MGAFDSDLNSKSEVSVQTGQRPAAPLDSGLRRNDGKINLATFCEVTTLWYVKQRCDKKMNHNQPWRC
jgi:hypothetical protein